MVTRTRNWHPDKCRFRYRSTDVCSIRVCVTFKLTHTHTRARALCRLFVDDNNTSIFDRFTRGNNIVRKNEEFYFLRHCLRDTLFTRINAYVWIHLSLLWIVRRAMMVRMGISWNDPERASNIIYPFPPRRRKNKISEFDGACASRVERDEKGVGILIFLFLFFFLFTSICPWKWHVFENVIAATYGGCLLLSRIIL